MKDFFSNLLLGYRAEHIKLRGTAFYIVSVIVGVLCPLMYFIVLTFDTNLAEMQADNYYRQYIEQVLPPFVNFFFPLLIIISVSRITQFDHRNGGWQLMELQPLERASIYFSKMLIVITAACISIIAFVLFSFMFGLIATFFREVPENVSQSFEGIYVLQLISRLLVATLFLIAFQYLISTLISSFIWSILIGFAGLLTFLFLNGFNIAPDWLPYDMISRISRYQNGSDLGYWFTYTDILSIVLSLFVSAVGFQWYRNKRFTLAFLTRKTMVVSAIVLALTATVVWYLLKPNISAPHNRTVISGRFDSDMQFDEVKVVSGIDTIAVIPVIDNSFTYTTSDKITFGKHILYAKKTNLEVIFGTNDSVFFKIRFKKNRGSLLVSGTRLAENQWQPSTEGIGSVAIYLITHNQELDNPKWISERIHDEWEELTDKKQFKTVDNYVAREDFVNRIFQLNTVYYLNYWNDYVRRRAVAYDTSNDVIPEKIQHMVSKVSLRDEGLLDDDNYTKYVLSSLSGVSYDGAETSQKQLEGISKLEAGGFKDKLLYKVLNKTLYFASDDRERKSLMDTYAPQLGNAKYKNALLAQANLAESLGRGKAAPAFVASTLEGTAVSLKDLEGKMIVIDVWASWCGPCRQQSPYFERIATKYGNEKIQFVALSTDESLNDWIIDAKIKSKTVMQLHVNDPNQFAKNYSVQTIPRYILIDSTGHLLNAELPPPTDTNFEVILKNELGVK
jgi:thiol-disulfide isomerase/thioredoxin